MYAPHEEPVEAKGGVSSFWFLFFWGLGVQVFGKRRRRRRKKKKEKKENKNNQKQKEKNKHHVFGSSLNAIDVVPRACQLCPRAAERNPSPPIRMGRDATLLVATMSSAVPGSCSNNATAVFHTPSSC